MDALTIVSISGQEGVVVWVGLTASGTAQQVPEDVRIYVWWTQRIYFIKPDDIEETCVITCSLVNVFCMWRHEKSVKRGVPGIDIQRFNIWILLEMDLEIQLNSASSSNLYSNYSVYIRQGRPTICLLS